MIQSYSIILWRKPEMEKISFEEIAHRAYDSLFVLQKYDEIFRPNYLTVNKKGDASKFEWSYNIFSEELQKKVMKIGKKEISVLGYSLSFFSSLNDDESCGISIRVGNKDSRFVNSLVINLPVCIDYSEEKNSNMLKTLFSELVNCFEPYWGCVSSNTFIIDDRMYMSGNNPLYLHWLNYWSNEVALTVNGIFFEKIKNMPDISYRDGILQIGKRAFDYKNDNDMEYFKNINSVYLKDCMN